MFKTAAMLLIAVGFALGGRWLAAYQQKRVELISSVILMLNIIENQLRFACLPVADLLRIISETGSLSELCFIKSVREKVCFGEPFPAAWRECVENEKELCRLLDGCVTHLIRLGDDIGSTDLEGQLSCCRYYKEIFDGELAVQQEKSRKYTKLFPSLGLLAGISAAILIV